MKDADIIVPGNRDNKVSIKFIVQNLKSQLKVKTYTLIKLLN